MQDKTVVPFELVKCYKAEQLTAKVLLNRYGDDLTPLDSRMQALGNYMICSSYLAESLGLSDTGRQELFKEGLAAAGASPDLVDRFGTARQNRHLRRLIFALGHSAFNVADLVPGIHKVHRGTALDLSEFIDGIIERYREEV